MSSQPKPATGLTSSGKPILYRMALPEGVTGAYVAAPKGGGPKEIFLYGNPTAPKGVDLTQAAIIADLTARLTALGG